MKKIVWWLFNLLRTLSLLIVLGAIGLYIYFQVEEDLSILEARAYSIDHDGVDEIYMAGMPSAAPFSNDKRGLGEVGNKQLFFRPDEFLYSEHRNKSTTIWLQDGKHKLATYVATESMEMKLRSMGIRTFLLRDRVINLDEIRALRSSPRPRGSGYTYEAVMVGEVSKTVAIPEKRYKELQDSLVNRYRYSVVE